jgi:eukaryotic-like serine/threonine-protein kinase
MDTQADAQRHAQLRQLTGAALEIDAGLRDAWLVQACAGDAALLAEAQHWLAAIAQAEAGDFLAAAGPAAATVIGTGQQRYELLREIGRGGMGTVYLAERVDGDFRQQVALKTLHVETRSDALPADRLRAERQILARLQHPHIARLLDGGTDAAGRPFLVMEYVPGERIDHWCGHNSTTLQQRVALLLPVCDALAYAHQQLVVHRDIKPGNILVDTQGKAKLLDFGIAKLLADEATATASGEQLLTFRYASPEQIRGDSVGTASDVYSLAVVLYRLLTGRLPYASDSAGAAEMARAVLDDAPATTQRRGARDGAAEPARRPLPADLEAILLRALRKAPQQRYASAAQFGDDLRRHLAGLPVMARQGQRGYALRSFLRRHRWGVAAGTLGFAALIAFTTMLKIQLDRTALERDRANAVAGFLASMFEDSNPVAEVSGDSAARAAITVREVLDRAAPRIETELAAQPQVQATLLGAVGRVYSGLDQRDSAERYLTLALARLAVLDTAPSLEKVELLLAPCQVRGIRGREQTVAACAEGLAMTRALPRGNGFALARLLRAQGSALRLNGRFEEAEAHFTEALALFHSARRPEWVQGVQADLAELAYLRGEPARCLALIEPAVAQWTAQFGAGNALRANLLSTRSQCNLATGKVAEAETDLRAALALTEQAVGAGAAVGNRAQLLNDLGLVLNRADRFAEAEPLLREALRIAEQLYGDEHAEISSVLNALSQSIDGQGKVDEGIALLRRSVAICAKGQGDADRRGHAIALNNLGFRLVREARYGEAEPLLRESLALWTALDPQHPDRAASLVNLGTLLLETGAPADALPLLREGLVLREKHMQPGSLPIETARSVLGACLAALGQSGEGLPLLQSSHTALLGLLGPQHRRTRDALRRLRAAGG